MSQPEHKLELEGQFILRLPQTQANALRQAIKSGEPLAKRLSIKFDTDIRHGNVRFDNCSMPARLYDLPTIIESYKTLDRKNFYKTADISQILICKQDPEPDKAQLADSDLNKARYDNLFSSIGGNGKREFLYPHGITPPLKNVRKRRFRKTLKKKYVDLSEIEKEVKRLFKFDCEAIETRYEIVEESKALQAPFNQDSVASPLENGPAGMQSTENSQNIDLQGLFGESSSNESDDDDDDDEDDDREDELEIDAENDNDDEPMDDEDLEDVNMSDQQQTMPAPDIADETAAASDLIAQNDDKEERHQKLNCDLNRIRDRILTQESEMSNLDNQALRMRLQPVLDSLREQESEIKKQLDELN